MHEPSEEAVTQTRRSRWGCLLLVVVLLGCVILAELGARYVLGLGDPPLIIADSETEYRFAPSRSYSRFGNTVSFNSYSMRSDEFPVSKEDPDELRVLVIGDSIVYGGVLLDQEEIATERLQGMLEDTLDRPVRVANISAGTWGPENFLAYVEKFGLFDADFVFVVVNAGDSHDVTTFEPLERNKRLITRTPTLALEEGVLVYLPRYLPFLFPKPPPSVRDESPEVHARTTGALRSLLEQAKASGATTTLVLHPRRGQALGDPAAGLDLLAAVAGEAGVRLIDLREPYRVQIQEAQLEVHQRDRLHLNAHGQEILAESMHPVITDSLELLDSENGANDRRLGTHQEHGHRLADDVARADAYATCPAERDLRRLDQLDHGKSATRHEAAPAVDDLADAGGRTSHASIVAGVFVTLYVPAVETVLGRLFVAEVAGAGP